MKRIISLAVVLGVVSAVSLSGMQRMTLIHPGAGGSPHILTEWQVEGANISIQYGRPYLRGRTIGDPDFVPYGEVWRVGADEATTLISDKDLVFGKLTVKAGEYTLWILPTEEKWQLIVSKDKGIFGTDYNPDNDLGRVEMTIEDVRPRKEQHTISIDPVDGGGILRVEFGTARATIPFTVKK